MAKKESNFKTAEVTAGVLILLIGVVVFTTALTGSLTGASLASASNALTGNAIGASCKSNLDCARTEVCSGGYCQPATPTCRVFNFPNWPLTLTGDQVCSQNMANSKCSTVGIFNVTNYYGSSTCSGVITYTDKVYQQTGTTSTNSDQGCQTTIADFRANPPCAQVYNILTPTRIYSKSYVDPVRVTCCKAA